MPKTVERLDLTGDPLSPATIKGYINHLERLDKWLKGRPETDETLSDYIIYLYEKGDAPGSADMTLAAVSWRCLSEDRPVPREKLCGAAVKNFKRRAIGRGNGQVDGIMWEMADVLRDLATGEKTIYGYRDAAWIGVMSDCMLRVSEAVDVDMAHVDFAAKTLFIPKSKTDQMGKGEVLYLGPPTIDCIRTWLEKAKISELADGPLFRPIHKDFLRPLKRRLCTYTIRDLIKARCKQAGFKGRFSGHSFRVGSAQSLAATGATLVEMQHAGRWKSPNMPAHYSRKFTAQQSPMARYRYGSQ